MSICWNLVLQIIVFSAAAKSISLTPLTEAVEWRLSDSGSNDTFLNDIRVKSREDNIDVVGRTFVVQILKQFT